MKRTIEIDDTLQNRVEQCIEELKDAIKDYYLENPDTTDLCLSNDIDYNGAFHEIIDSNVPIYTNEIDGLWYLHKHDFIDAYQNVGFGDDPTENNGMTAIYCFLQEQAWEWWHDNHETIQDQMDDIFSKAPCSKDLEKYINEIEELN